MANKYFKNRGNVIKSRNFKPNAPGGKPSKSTGPDPLKLANPKKKIETKTETKKKVYQDKILRDAKKIKEKKSTGPDPLKLANPKKKTETNKKPYEDKILRDSKRKENKSKQSFGEAFKAAKKAGVKEFDYNGKKYAAVTEDEVKKSGSKNLREYLNKRNKAK
tara:strand:+ start:161 stop:649 length:489 start_codon:yes stop_codon:yes gene_type:complete